VIPPIAAFQGRMSGRHLKLRVFILHYLRCAPSSKTKDTSSGCHCTILLVDFPYVLYPSAHQAFTSAVYSSAASSHTKWRESSRCSSLCGSRSWRYSALTGGTTVSLRPATICTGVCMCGRTSRYFKLRRVGPDVTDRLCESIAFVRSQVVLASGVAERIALERVDRALDDRTSTEPSVRFKVSNRASVFAGSLSTKRIDTQSMTRNVGLTAISLRRWFCWGVVMTRSPSGPLTSSIAPEGRRLIYWAMASITVPVA
jgi:hypothetical protein